MLSRTYAIEEILAVRDRFLDPPYPGFSLFEVCRRKAATSSKLERGLNAWAPHGACSSEEGIRKAVRGALNKLAPEKYDEIAETFKTPQMIEEDSLEAIVPLIFEKALHEPGYAPMYAKLCYDIATYELDVMKASPNKGVHSPLSPTPEVEPRRRSRFRELIVSEAQHEFSARPEEDALLLESADDPEAREEAYSALCSRKKANIKFVGHLYVRKVLSSTIMHRIIDSILNPPQAVQGGSRAYPKDIDIHVLTELLENIGPAMDSSEDGKIKMDRHFKRLRELLETHDKKRSERYPARIRFRIMDTLELRENAWVQRVARASVLTPSTIKERTEILSKVSTPSPTRRGVPKFPEAPPPPSAYLSSNWRGAQQPAQPSAHTPNSFPPSNPGTPSMGVPGFGKADSSSTTFEARCKQLLQEYLAEVEDSEQQSFRGWMERFKSFGLSDDQLRIGIVREIALSSCLASRSKAQFESCQFLVLGLEIEPSELVIGFGQVLRSAIVDDLSEDTPKFFERLVAMISMCSVEGTPTANYRDVAATIFHAFVGLQEEGMASLDSLLKVWCHVPATSLDPSIVRTLVEICLAICPGARELLARMLHSMADRGVIPPEAVKEAEAIAAEGSEAEISSSIQHLPTAKLL